MEYFKAWLDPTTFDNLKGNDAAAIILPDLKMHEGDLLIAFRDCTGERRDPLVCAVTSAQTSIAGLKPGFSLFSLQYVAKFTTLGTLPSMQEKPAPAETEAL